ncbi:MAG: hypothetical protein BHW06_00260 [Clostridium sp. 44_14]|nr:MAG: hypothetical protein BHW06_00260 [Clostridium sp. 44_14]
MVTIKFIINRKKRGRESDMFQGEKRKQKNKRMSMMLAVIMLAVQLLGVMPVRTASAASDTADLRIMFTTDLHGQVVDVDYSKGTLFANGGLTKASTLLTQAKSEVPDGNTLLFDLGDVMYDYTTDYIYEHDQNEIQPIYQAMASLNYDAIILGNHDYEYTLPYIQKQYEATGLKDKVIASNITDAVTGKHVFNENKIIEKTLTTADGSHVTVKVGVIGESIPTLSKKRCDYTGVLAGEDMVANVQKETKKLKDAGADVVVVLAHSGVGTEQPALMDENVGYALTKIDGVDAVLCGHKHSNFCADGTTYYDKYEGVDTKNHLVNGKNLVMVANSGRGIGVIDLGISPDKRIVSRKSQIRKTKNNTAIDQKIAAYMDKWGATFAADSTEVLAELKSDARWQNYLGTLEDSSPIQLLNDMAISYGMEYQNNDNTDCKGLPVVAASRYSRYGAGSGLDYYDIKDYFTSADLYQLMNYRIQLWRYKVTGAQLREWLEWSASAYETAGNNVVSGPAISSSPAPEETPEITPSGEPSVTPETSGNPEQTPEVSDVPDVTAGPETTPEAVETAAVMENPFETQKLSAGNKGISQTSDLLAGILNYKGSRPLQYSLREMYLTDLSRFYILDGVEYTIDTSVAPRYDYDGKKINDTWRVTSMTRNGQEIKDTDQFLLIVNRLDTTAVPEMFKVEAMTKLSMADTRDYFKKYLMKQAECGTLGNLEDNNWNVKYSDKYYYILKTGSAAQDIVNARSWIKEKLDSSEDFDYYRARLDAMDLADHSGPDLNLAALTEIETNHPVKVAVQATDRSGIVSLSYLSGKYLADSIAWNNAKAVQNGVFAADKNTIYSVRAVDGQGNVTIRYIRINNINEGILEAPKVDTYTNRKLYISGKAEPVTTIYFELEDSTVYKTTVNDNGSFKYALPPQNAGKKIFVYVKDDEGRCSARTVVTVKRTGPNKPVMEKLTTAVRTVTGEINDKNVYPFFILDSKKTVFMQDDGTEELYKQCELYNKDYTVEKIAMNIASDGSYTFSLPYLLTAKTEVKMRTVDVANRVSMGTKRVVKQTVPAKPTMQTVTNLSTKVKVFSEEKCKSATITVGKKKYKITKKKYVASKKMYRYQRKITKTNSGVKVNAYLTNTKGNSPVLKTKKIEVVPDTPKVDKLKAGLKKVTGHVDVVGDGTEADGVTVENTNTKVFILVNGKKYIASIDFGGNYTVKLKKPLISKDKVIVKARNKKGMGIKKKYIVK